MRVEPELMRHPKFKALKRRVGDYAAEALLWLWGHCQDNQRGETWVGKGEEYLEEICCWDGEKGLLFRSFKETGWIHEENGCVIVHDWNEMNRQFISNWKQGPRGGRPRKPNGNPSVIDPPQPGENLAVNGQNTPQNVNRSVNRLETDWKPTGNPPETDRVTDCTKPNFTSLSSLEGGVGETPKTDWKPTGNPSVNSGLRFDLATEVLNFLNQQTGASFPASPITLHFISHRLLEVNQDVAGVQEMIRRQVLCWKDNREMQNFLRPSTLFDEEKFPNYFGQRKMAATGGGGGKDRRAELQGLIDTSPANRESVYHKPTGASAEDREKLKRWREELRGMAT